MSGLYNMSEKAYDKDLDLTCLRPYGDTMNDAKVQLSFTLPVKHDEKGDEAARLLAKQMGIQEPTIAFSEALDKEFSFYIVYGACVHSVDYTGIAVASAENATMGMDEIDEYIRVNIGRKIVVLGASTGTDAHTVGIDAIMNRKGFAGHYGLERYDMIEAHNMGSQVPNEAFLARAEEISADVLLVSQTVTQKNIHIKNLTELIELAEAECVRNRYVFCCGGARITSELAKELGFDAGFGTGKYADDVATFAALELHRRGVK